MKIKPFNNEVVIADEAVVKLRRADTDALKEGARKNERRRMRLCAHQSNDAALHEMFIVVTKDVYIRPHKHLAKAESLHVLEGEVDVVFYDENGAITDILEMGDFASGKLFYYRVSDPVYHTLVLKSETLSFHEATTGPFDRAQTVYAPWSPEETDKAGVKKFREDLEARLKRPQR